MSDFTSYFGSYARRSPAWQERVSKNETIVPGYTEEELAKFDAEEGMLCYERVNADNYPKIYAALREECEFRNVEMPACYIDHTGGTRLGQAIGARYTVLIQPEIAEDMTEDEAQALVSHEIKHLYQDDSETAEQSRLAELDCDESAVTSTSYKTIQSYVHKAATCMIKDRLPQPLQGIALAFHRTFPNLAAEFCFLRLDDWHPSPGHRMMAMREVARLQAEPAADYL